MVKNEDKLAITFMKDLIEELDILSEGQNLSNMDTEIVSMNNELKLYIAHDKKSNFTALLSTEQKEDFIDILFLRTNKLTKVFNSIRIFKDCCTSDIDDVVKAYLAFE